MAVFGRFVVRLLPIAPKFIVKRIAGRYVAGSDINSAVTLMKKMSSENTSFTIDVLGEEIKDLDEKRKSDLAIFQTETGRQLFLNIFDFLYKQNWGMIPQGVKYFPLANEYIQPDKSGFIYSSRKGDFEQRTFLECTVGQGDAISQGNNSIYVEMRDGKAQLVRKTFKGRYPKNLVVPEIKGVYKSRKRNGILQKKWKDGTSIVNGCRSPHTETELAKLEKIAKQVEADLLLFFEESSAIDSYLEAAQMYQKKNKLAQATAIYEHLVLLL